nr:hypothetical protein [Tanacetum cinerariifolium]
MPLLPAMLLQAQAGEGAESLSMTTVLTHMRLLLALSQLWKMHLWEAISIPLPQGPLMLPLQKVHSLEAELHNNKRLFKDVVGKLVKKVKTLEVKLKTKKRKMVVSDSDQEDNNTQDVELDALRALANAVVAVDSDIPPAVPSGTSNVPAATSAVPSGTFVVPAATSAVPSSTYVVPAATSVVPAGRSNVHAGVSSKGKSPMVEEDIPVKARTFKQMEEDRLGDETAKRLHDEEMTQMESERAEAWKKRQQEVLDSAMYYSKYDWLNIRAQVEANTSLSKTLLGDDESEDNFPVVVNEDSDDEDSDNEVWSAVVGWEVLLTPLGEINSLYHIDSSTKHFATLRQIFHMVDRQDLMKLYGLVGEGFLCLAKSTYVGDTKLENFRVYYSRINPQVLTGRVIVPTGRYIVPTSRVIVATGRYVVPAGTDIAKITRKPDKNGHENGKSTQEPGIIKKSQHWSFLVNSQNDKTFQNPQISLNV